MKTLGSRLSGLYQLIVHILRKKLGIRPGPMPSVTLGARPLNGLVNGYAQFQEQPSVQKKKVLEYAERSPHSFGLEHGILVVLLMLT